MHLAQDRSAIVRTALAQSSPYPEVLVTLLSDTDFLNVQSSAITNPHIPLEHLVDWAQSDNEGKQAAAFVNPKLAAEASHLIPSETNPAWAMHTHLSWELADHHRSLILPAVRAEHLATDTAVQDA